jgi:hypothetical protein
MRSSPRGADVERADERPEAAYSAKRLPCLPVERAYEMRWNMNNLNRDEIERFCQEWEIVGEEDELANAILNLVQSLGDKDEQNVPIYFGKHEQKYEAELDIKREDDDLSVVLYAVAYGRVILDDYYNVIEYCKGIEIDKSSLDIGKMKSFLQDWTLTGKMTVESLSESIIDILKRHKEWPEHEWEYIGFDSGSIALEIWQDVVGELPDAKPVKFLAIYPVAYEIEQLKFSYKIYEEVADAR